MRWSWCLICLLVVDVSGSAPGAPAQLATGVIRFAWSPDSTALAYVEDDVGVFVRRIGGSDAVITVETIPVDELVSNMKWSPTGRLGYELGGYSGVIKVGGKEPQSTYLALRWAERSRRS